MKKIILFFSAVLLLLKTQAQDIIVKISGDELPVKITEITLNDIVYKHPDSLSGQPRTIPKKEVFMVKYANGAKEVITTMDVEPAGALPEERPEIMYQRGKTDARIYYKGAGTLWGSAAASLLPPYGYVVPLGLMLTKPKIANSTVPDMRLLQNKDYVKGFEKQAHNRKIGKALAGMGIGTVVITTALMIFLVSVY